MTFCDRIGPNRTNHWDLSLLSEAVVNEGQDWWIMGSPLILVLSHLIITGVLKNYLRFIDTLFYGVSDVGSNVMGANGNIVATSFK